MAISNLYSSLARPDLIITEYRFLIHSMQKVIRKLLQEFDRDPTVGSKLWPIRTVTQAWHDQTSSSPSITSTSTQWKTASGKLQKEFYRDPTVGSKVMAISNRYSSVARPDLINTEYRFLIHSMQQGIWKL